MDKDSTVLVDRIISNVRSQELGQFAKYNMAA